MIKELIQQDFLRSPAIIKAFQKIDRENFLPAEMKDYADANQALPIGFGQTISQPLVVAFMLEELQPQLGQTVLDIGTGSGWTTALLAEIVGSNGWVVSVEVIADLCQFGRENVSRLGYQNVDYRCGDWAKIVENTEKFDRIQAAATAKRVPEKLLRLLKFPGRLVLPVEHQRGSDHVIKTIVKDEKGKIKEVDHPGFLFVPLL